MLHLCREVLSEGKRLYLFYKNPEARRIYQRICFKDFGRWASAYI
jgi:predicted GNAT family acetyltransferase